MPIELILSPLMRPVVMAKSLVFSPHRRASRYIPHIIDSLESDSQDDNQINPSDIQEYAIRRRFGSGSKIFDVYDTLNGQLPIGSTNHKDSLYHFIRSRSVKGAYKMYSSKIKNTGFNPETNEYYDEPVAAVRAGLRSNVLLIRAPEVPQSELGWHVINHRVDALDAYRMFTLADGTVYQWTTEGKFLEKVTNVGEKESEIRERIGQVVPAANHGFNLKLNTSKIPLELALSTALCSYIDHWNTNIKVGGIYYPRQNQHVRWKRD